MSMTHLTRFSRISKMLGTLGPKYINCDYIASCREDLISNSRITQASRSLLQIIYIEEYSY